jgi:hypothetical protein
MAPKTIKETAIAPDGSRVTFACRAERIQAGWHWHMRLTSNTLAISAAVAVPDYFDHAVSTGRYSPGEEISYAGRPLVLGVNNADNAWLAAWKGTHHCLVFGGLAPAPSLTSLVGVLTQLSIVDRPDGMTVRPLPGSGIITWGLSGIRFADAGMVTIFRRSEASQLLPSEAGLRVEHGQVWSKKLETESGARDRKFLHAGDTAVCTIEDDLGRDPAVTKAGQEELLSSLDVRWAG